jgi:hypothetical protein
MKEDEISKTQHKWENEKYLQNIERKTSRREHLGGNPV